jgi:hypothetical protein
MEEDRIMEEDPIMEEEDRIMAGPTTVVMRVPWRWGLVIGLTTFTGLVITEATRITSGKRDIGHREMAREYGSTAITSCEDTDRVVFVAADLKRLAA